MVSVLAACFASLAFVWNAKLFPVRYAAAAASKNAAVVLAVTAAASLPAAAASIVTTLAVQEKATA
jgi:hypothetical protein